MVASGLESSNRSGVALVEASVFEVCSFRSAVDSFEFDAMLAGGLGR